jgi:hypothetical protein
VHWIITNNIYPWNQDSSLKSYSSMLLTIPCLTLQYSYLRASTCFPVEKHIHWLGSNSGIKNLGKSKSECTSGKISKHKCSHFSIFSNLNWQCHITYRPFFLESTEEPLQIEECKLVMAMDTTRYLMIHDWTALNFIRRPEATTDCDLSSSSTTTRYKVANNITNYLKIRDCNPWESTMGWM